jgi:hypothetical protein
MDDQDSIPTRGRDCKQAQTSTRVHPISYLSRLCSAASYFHDAFIIFNVNDFNFIVLITKNCKFLSHASIYQDANTVI